MSGNCARCNKEWNVSEFTMPILSDCQKIMLIAKCAQCGHWIEVAISESELINPDPDSPT